ncbi:MAG: TetR/AcrR family transcriptional regulator, partial [Planctomycetota bacterium]
MIERLSDNAAHTDPGRTDTPTRLLEAAIDTFADKGYHNATVAEICSAAGANVAAVNYHFGSKQNLYVAAWRKAFQDSVAAHPPDGGVPPGASARRRFRARIGSVMHRVLDPARRAPAGEHVH